MLSRMLWLALALLLWRGNGGTSLAADAAPQTYEEYEVKAAFLYNFAKFVDWPEDAFPDAGAPLVIGILGDDPFGGALEQIIKTRLINGRKTVIKHFKNQPAQEPCHVLFISPKERKSLPQILKALAGKSTLTVGEAENFTQLGGIINFVNRDDKVGFEINEDAAQRANLKISSKLLKLAKVVRDGHHP